LHLGNEEISKTLKEINYAIKRAKFQWQAESEVSAPYTMRYPKPHLYLFRSSLFHAQSLKSRAKSQAATNQITQTHIDDQSTSKNIQTDLLGCELEKIRKFYDKYLDNQLKLDVDLR
jgi:hypothetical protein